MKFNQILILLCLLPILLAGNESTVKNEPEEVHYTNIYEANALPSKSNNPGNALDAPTEGELGATIQDEFIKLIRDKACREYNISNAYWEFCSGFGICDDECGNCNNYLLNALTEEEE